MKIKKINSPRKFKPAQAKIDAVVYVADDDDVNGLMSDCGTNVDDLFSHQEGAFYSVGKERPFDTQQFQTESSVGDVSIQVVRMQGVPDRLKLRKLAELAMKAFERVHDSDLDDDDLDEDRYWELENHGHNATQSHWVVMEIGAAGTRVFTFYRQNTGKIGLPKTRMGEL